MPGTSIGREATIYPQTTIKGVIKDKEIIKNKQDWHNKNQKIKTK